MTNAELKDRFLIGYEFIANHLAPGYTNEEISGFLNQAQDLLIDELYERNNIANLAELISKVTDSLDEDYIVPPEIFNLGECVRWTAQNAFEDFRWFINAKAKITRTEPFIIATEWIEANIIEKTEAEKWVQTSINKPIIIYPKIIYFGNQTGFAVLYDSYSTLSGLQVMYIKNATRIVIGAETYTCDLNVRLHQKVVDKAIALAMKATDVQRAQAEIQVNQAI